MTAPKSLSKSELTELAQGLLVGADFENLGKLRQRNLLQGLARLGTLELITTSSLGTPSPEVSPAPGAQAPALSAPAPRKPVVYRSARQEYLPAIQNESVIEALLQLQGEKDRKARQKETESGFAPHAAPEVKAKPKEAPVYRRSPGIYHPILKPERS